MTRATSSMPVKIQPSGPLNRLRPVSRVIVRPSCSRPPFGLSGEIDSGGSVVVLVLLGGGEAGLATGRAVAGRRTDTGTVSVKSARVCDAAAVFAEPPALALVLLPLAGAMPGFAGFVF